MKSDDKGIYEKFRVGRHTVLGWRAGDMFKKGDIVDFNGLQGTVIDGNDTCIDVLFETDGLKQHRYFLPDGKMFSAQATTCLKLLKRHEKMGVAIYRNATTGALFISYKVATKEEHKKTYGRDFVGIRYLGEF